MQDSLPYRRSNLGATMRIGSGLSYLLADHLGSPAMTVNAATNAVTRTGYTPWGEERYGAAPSIFSYTGQRDEPYILGSLRNVAY